MTSVAVFLVLIARAFRPLSCWMLHLLAPILTRFPQEDQRCRMADENYLQLRIQNVSFSKPYPYIQNTTMRVRSWARKSGRHVWNLKFAGLINLQSVVNKVDSCAIVSIRCHGGCFTWAKTRLHSKCLIARNWFGSCVWSSTVSSRTSWRVYPKTRHPRYSISSSSVR